MDGSRLAFGAGLALLFGAVFVAGGVDPSGSRFDMPAYLRIPAVTVLIGGGTYLVFWSVRRLWRDRDVLTLVILFGILGYIGVAAVYSIVS